MNRTAIEWTDYTWNVITGCDHSCWYCYAPNGFKPTFHPERLLEPYLLKKPSKIFCCSISDLFAPWTPIAWRDQVLASIEACPVKHIFQLLTKNPELIPYRRKAAYVYPENVWIGATVTCEHADPVRSDWINIELIKKAVAGVRYVSFEPLLGMLPWEVSLKGLDWIIIGKLTGSRRVKLNPVWILRILREAQDLGIPVFMKNNIEQPLIEFLEAKRVQEFPR